MKKASALAVAALSLFVTNVQSQTDSYCETNPEEQSVIQAFRMENGIENSLYLGNISRSILSRYFDSALNTIQVTRPQNVAFVSSAPYAADCEGSGTDCIGAYSPQSSTCGAVNGGSFVSNGVYASGRCSSGSCEISICPEHPNSINTTFLRLHTGPVTLLAHEVGHTYGLDHPNLESSITTPYNGCTVPSLTLDGCSAEGTATDGCDGELMCSTSPCILGPPQRGDEHGIRLRMNGSTGTPQRQVSQIVMGPDQASLVPPDVASFYLSNGGSIHSGFPPRIDCVKATGITNDCAAVRRTSSGTPVQLTRLRETAGSTIQWDSAVDIGASSLSVLFTPDVAVRPDGVRAFVVVARASQAGALYLVEFNLTTGAIISSTSLDGIGGLGLTRSLAVRPPRVVWSPALGQPVVFGYLNTVGLPPGFGQPNLGVFPSATPPVMKVLTVDGSGNVVTIADTTNSLVDFTNRVSGAYDVDCADSGSTFSGVPIDSCVFVGPVRSTLADDHHLTVREIQIRPPVGAETVPQLVGLTANTLPAFPGLLGVEGVSIKTTGVMGSSKVFVVASREYASNTTAGNARLIRGNGATLSGATSLLFVTDFEDSPTVCALANDNGINMPTFTPRQGVSMAWCHDCGLLQGFGFSPPAGGGLCF